VTTTPALWTRGPGSSNHLGGRTIQQVLEIVRKVLHDGAEDGNCSERQAEASDLESIFVLPNEDHVIGDQAHRSTVDPVVKRRGDPLSYSLPVKNENSDLLFIH